jgi:DNA mismatch repair protein MutS2
MRARDLVALELPRVYARLSEFAASAAGREACLALQPSSDRGGCEREVGRTWDCHRLLEQVGQPPLSALEDIRPHLRRAAHPGFVLDGKALVEVRAVLEVARGVGAFFRKHVDSFPSLKELADGARSVPPLETSLRRALDDEGNVRDEASEELGNIRRTIRDLRERLTERLENLVFRRDMADIVGDQYVTIRNNRFVVPIRAGAADRIQGVVQDRSASGETWFVEPLFAVGLNNQLLMAVKEEEAIVRRILADLTDLVRAHHGEIGSVFDTLVRIDVLLAKVKFARAYRCTQPSFSEGDIDLRRARHSILSFTGRPVTPIDIVLPSDKCALVVTGPNTGGKTVALKTLGLCALMAQSGLLVPAAEGARLPCFSAVFADVGDEQNIERDLSTFSAHLTNLREVLASDLSSALVLLDEPGVGTDPEEGAALAVGLLQRLVAAGARVAVTTHYMPVKLFAVGQERYSVAAVDFDLDTLTPLYRLVYHSLGQSLGLAIAQRLGIPAEVLAQARAVQSDTSRNVEAAVSRLEETRRHLERRIEEVDRTAATLAEQRDAAQRLVEELRARRRKAWGEELQEARSFLRTIKSEGTEVLRALRSASSGRDVLERFAREGERAIREREISLEPEDAAAPRANVAPKIGDTVEVGEGGIRGELLSIEGERAWVQRGSLRFEVAADQLRAIGQMRTRSPRVAVAAVASGAASGASEISLIGLRAREAVEELERFLDRAAQAHHSQVKIVHGIGSGALRRAVHEHLSRSPYCGGFRSGEDAEGGAGVTVAFLES